MTAQIGDIYKYGKKEYRIVAMSAGMPFNPKYYGLEPHPSSTACYRGYWCEYSVDDEKLVLKNMYMFNMDDNYPPLNGIEVAPQEYEECWGSKPGMKGIQKITVPAYMGHRAYKELNMLIPYTGKILLGDGFMHEYYIHMGFQRAWAYKKLIEFVFDEVGFNRMEAKHDVRNPHSGGVMKKCGMTFEGTLRQVGLNRNNEFFSCDLYSILRSEWDKKKNTKAIKRSDG